MYVNHNLRDDVELDVSFVKEFSQKHNLKFYIKEVDIQKLVKEHKLSEEEAGRYGRYKVFSEIYFLRKKRKAQIIRALNIIF